MGTIETVKVSSRGQIVIPEDIRNDLDITQGTKLVVIEKDDGILLKKEEIFLKQLSEQEESRAAMILSMGSFRRLWDNKKDDETWSRY